MKFRLKQLTAAVMTATFCMNTALAANIGLLKANIISAALEGTKTSTPEENSFTYDGKSYILLDTEEKDGETVFFIMSEECIGVREIDADNQAKFDISDENNIAYWLNNDFLASENLPQGIIDNIDYNHEWHTEPSNLEGFEEEYTTVCGVSLLSLYEYENYISEFGTTVPDEKVVAWWLRTARGAGTTSSKYQLAVPFSKPGTVTRAEADTASLHVRPVFYLTESFFEECKITDIGDNVLKAMDENLSFNQLSEMYTEAELKEYFTAPSVYDIIFTGEDLVGGNVSVEYEYDGAFDEAESLITWVWDEDIDGDYSNEIYTGTEKVLTVPEGMEGKYIKVKITPLAEKGIFGEGDEVISESAVGPIKSVDEALNERKEKLPEEINNASVSDKVRILLENKDLFSVEFSDDYRATLTGYMLAKETFSDFAELDDKVSKAYNTIKSKIVDGESLEGLTKQNRIGQTTPLVGAVNETPEENIFKYNGYDYVVLDNVEKSGKTYFYVITKNYFGTYAFDASGQNRHFYDVYDSDNIGHWLNTEFLAEGNSGMKLPDEIISNMDITHIWHTEPTNYSGYTKESLSVGPIGLISNTEWCKYVAKLGNDISGANDVYWFRTARAGAVTTHTTVLTSCPSVAGTTLEKNASVECLVRPTFYLSEDFFREHKCEAIGENISKEIDALLTKEEVESLYSEEEINKIFKSPKITDAKIGGIKMIGEELFADYSYSSPFEESEVKYRWQVSNTENGVFSDISGATDKTFIVTQDIKGKYIRAGLIPVSNANINPEGEEFFTDSFGPIYAESDVTNAINNTEYENIEQILSDYNAILEIDLAFGGVSSDKKEEILKNVADTDYSKIKDIKNDIGQQILMAKIEESDKETVLEVIANDEFGFDTKRLEELPDTENISEALAGKEFGSYEELKHTYFESLCLEEMKNADRTTIQSILIYYDEYLKEDIGDFDEDELKALGVKVLKKDYESFEEFDKAVSDAIDEVRADNDNKTQGGGGSSSSGGSSSKKSAGTTPNYIKTEAVTKASDVFSDLGNVLWAKDAIEELAVKGIVNGVGENTFAPNELMTREQFVTIAVRVFGFSDANKSVEFSDVKDGTWYIDSIYKAYNAGAVNGIGENLFGIGQHITREQIVTILYRIAKDRVEFDINTALTFTDSTEIADYANEAVTAFCNKGFVTGYSDGTFSAKGNATRAECAVIIHRLLSTVEEG